SLLIAMVSMGLARIGWQSPSMGSAWRRTAAAMAGVGLSLAVSGHAATAPPEWVTAPAVFIHGVAVAFWVGALAPLLALGRKRNGELLPVLLRFSRLVLPVVGALVLTGLGLADVKLEGLSALIWCSYGISLLGQATRGPDGSWHVRAVPLPLAGRWHLRIDALVTDFEKVTLEGDFDLR